MVRIENDLKAPVKVKDTYQRGANPSYTDWTDEKASFSIFTHCFENEQYGHIALNHLPRKPGIVSCPNCLNSVYPRSRKRILPWTHYIAMLLSPLLCCFLPYILPCTQGKIHYCPYCKSNLGVSDIREPERVHQATWYIDFNALQATNV